MIRLLPPDAKPRENRPVSRRGETALRNRPGRHGQGQQHTPAFRASNPNGKVPVIVDSAGPGGVEARVFDSTAILLYLGEKTGELMGSPADREELLSWFLFMASGLGPFSGQAVHFQRAAPEKTAVRGQPLPTRGRTPLCCPRQAPRGPRVHCRRRVYDRRYFGLGLDHGRHWRRSRMAG